MLCATSLIQSTVTERWRVGVGGWLKYYVDAEVEKALGTSSYQMSKRSLPFVRSSPLDQVSHLTPPEAQPKTRAPVQTHHHPLCRCTQAGRQRKCIFIRPCLRLAQSCLSHCTVECRLNQPTTQPTIMHQHHALRSQLNAFEFS